MVEARHIKIAVSKDHASCWIRKDLTVMTKTNSGVIDSSEGVGRKGRMSSTTDKCRAGILDGHRDRHTTASKAQSKHMMEKGGEGGEQGTWICTGGGKAAERTSDVGRRTRPRHFTGSNRRALKKDNSRSSNVSGQSESKPRKTCKRRSKHSSRQCYLKQKCSHGMAWQDISSLYVASVKMRRASKITFSKLRGWCHKKQLCFAQFLQVWLVTELIRGQTFWQVIFFTAATHRNIQGVNYWMPESTARTHIHTATHSNTQWHTATHCNTTQRNATHGNTQWVTYWAPEGNARIASHRAKISPSLQTHIKVKILKSLHLAQILCVIH